MFTEKRKFEWRGYKVVIGTVYYGYFKEVPRVFICIYDGVFERSDSFNFKDNDGIKKFIRWLKETDRSFDRARNRYKDEYSRRRNQ